MQLEQYIRTLIERKDTRNSQVLSKFLSLDTFAPEIIFNQPELIVSKQLKQRYVTNCEFISKFNLFVVAVYDKSAKTTSVELYYFNQTGLIQDKYRLISQSEKVIDSAQGESRTSIVDIMQRQGSFKSLDAQRQPLIRQMSQGSENGF